MLMEAEAAEEAAAVHHEVVAEVADLVAAVAEALAAEVEAEVEIAEAEEDEAEAVEVVAAVPAEVLEPVPKSSSSHIKDLRVFTFLEVRTTRSAPKT